MREYEAVYIIKPNFEDEKYPEKKKKYTALIQNNGGEIVSVEPWGKKRLAYEIEKLREGYYVLTRFNAGPDLPQELERNFKIADEIMRYLIVKVGE